MAKIKTKPVVSAVETGTKGIQEDVWIPAICESTCVESPCLLRVHRVNGVAVGVEPNTQIGDWENLEKNHGRLCAKPYAQLQKLYNPHRIKNPMKRTNPEKGVGIDPKWVEISWEEALNTIAEKLKKMRGSVPIKLAEARGTGGMSAEGWYAFLPAFGPTQVLWGGRSTHCRQVQHAFGNRIHGGASCEPDLDYCQYLIIMGANPAAAGGAPENPLFAAARERGMKTIAIDPVLSPTAAKASEWLPIKPATDCAFILAMINVVIHEIKILDVPFLKDMTNSPFLVKPDGDWLRDKATEKIMVWDSIDQKAKVYDDSGIKDLALEGAYQVNGLEVKPSFQLLKDHVLQYTPEWAAAITTISAEKIRRITGDFVDNARIGSTIEIEGKILPYRPVATWLGRGVTGQIHSYQTVLAEHILAVLVGSLEVPGGHRGGLTEVGKRHADGILWGRPGPGRGVQVFDGMQDTRHHPFQWPPISYSGWEVLAPCVDHFPNPPLPYTDPADSLYSMDQLDWRNLVDPPKGLPVPPLPEMWIRHRSNPLLALGEAKYAIDVLKRIPFTVSISYTFDEVTDFADMLLPENLEFERYQLYITNKKACHRKYWTLPLQQPVIKPLYNTMDVNNILIELADRAGFLDEFNIQMNKCIGFDEDSPYKLETGKKYKWEEIVDRKCKFHTNGKYDMEWFKKNGALVRKGSVEEQYDIHFIMKSQKIRYSIPYMEIVEKTGKDLSRNLAEKGIDWWPTDEYTALPTYFPSVIEEAPAEYDFYVVNCRVASTSWGSNVGLPWVNEISAHIKGVGEVLMNTSAAKKRGIKEGDEIWIESPAGKIKQTVRLSQTIRPDSVLISGQFGQWGMPVAKETHRATISTLVPISVAWTDKLLGSQQSLCVKAKIYKAK
jgi:phenylacetyl-CoA:acceptor oxidoreductase